MHEQHESFEELMKTLVISTTSSLYGCLDLI